jgi:hypothetical protein
VGAGPEREPTQLMVHTSEHTRTYIRSLSLTHSAAARNPTTFNWTTIPLLGFAIYVYAVEIERQNWSRVLAGLAFWLMDWVNEIVNALVLRFTNYAPIWTATGHTSFEIFVGLNIEISLLFFIAAITLCKQLPRDPKARILGIVCPDKAVMDLPV